MLLKAFINKIEKRQNHTFELTDQANIWDFFGTIMQLSKLFTTHFLGSNKQCQQQCPHSNSCSWDNWDIFGIEINWAGGKITKYSVS